MPERIDGLAAQPLARVAAAWRHWPHPGDLTVVKAARILAEYTAVLYFPLNGLRRRQRVAVWPRLLLIEYLVYRVDAITERNRHQDLDRTRTSDYALLHRYKRRFEQLLRRLGAWSPAVADLVEDGEAFARLENAVGTRTGMTAADLRRVAELRPTDVRLLHAATMAMLSCNLDPDLRDALWPVEILADIANDLEHYTQDARESKFNIYAGYLALDLAGGSDRLRATIEDYRARAAVAVERLPPARREAVRTQTRALLRDRLDHLPPPVV